MAPIHESPEKVFSTAVLAARDWATKNGLELSNVRANLRSHMQKVMSPEVR